MNPNAEGNQEFGYDNRGGHGSRYKMNNRRGWRYRGGNDRGAYRNQRDRRNSSANRDNNRQPYVPQSIDISDSSQWPSIQEVSSGNIRSRQPTSNARQPDTAPATSEQPQRQNEADSPPGYRRGGSYSTGQHSLQQNAGPVGNYGGRPNAGYRNRGGRYGGSGRGYHGGGGYGRRYQRMPYQGFVPPLPTDHQLMSGYINGHVLFNPIPMAFMDERNKSAETLKQVEYYFSQQNLQNDYYMRSQMDQDGWVDLGLIYNFKRIQRLEISFDEYVKSLVPSELLEVDLETKKVRTSIDPKQWVLDGPPPADVSNSTGSSRKPSSSEAPYVPPMTQVSPMVFPVNPGYPMNPTRGRYFQQTIGVIPAPFYGYTYPEYAPGMYYQYYGQEYVQSFIPEVVNPDIHVDLSANDTTSQDVIQDSGVSITQTQSVAEKPTAEESISNNVVPVGEAKDLDELASKVTTLDIGSSPPFSSSQ
ncbi:La-related protein 1 [Thelohanellus kitauei]|uniref:La-related protein 1 n=1 Tax=Thelohanellus kitauei TaxID=669202 RepID=A0A0C2N7W3_THEKT|nr:La-related protein 1 [Thelohanellus kitauei]